MSYFKYLTISYTLYFISLLIPIVLSLSLVRGLNPTMSLALSHNTHTHIRPLFIEDTLVHSSPISIDISR
jgi:hypothetical protein